MVQECTDTFEVMWDNPADAQLHWSWDKMHHPRPVPPLCVDLIASESEHVFGSRIISLNGYIYAHGFTMPSPTPEVMERGAADVWENDYVPRIREACKRWRNVDYDSMTTEELLASIDEVIEEGGEMQRLTMVVAAVFGFPTNLLADFCEETLGEDGATLAATLLQGYDNLSSRPAAALAELATIASEEGQVAAALRERRFASLARLDGRFSERLEEYLEEYGWRLEGWGRYHVPTWAEDRTMALSLIAHYVDSTGSPTAAIERAIAQREVALREVESRLEGEKLERFRAMLAASLAHSRISEGRAFWQLVIDGSLRVPFVALGRRLVAGDVIDEPNDVFFLGLAELKGAASDNSCRLQETIASRKSELAHQETLIPPPFVGGPQPENPIPPALKRAVARFWGGEVQQTGEQGVVKGNPASRGIASGKARLIMTLADSGRLEDGEILVCPSTAPPWTPLFAIAAAVVTDTGGVLSHSAICAREYGIPAVVGTKIGTRNIPEGAIVTVDGAAGTVRIHA
jgi:pyruvate,water dikinase